MSQFEFGAYRYGWDAPSRVSTSTVFFQEQNALLPGEPRYQPLPFVSGTDTTSGIGGVTADGHPIWTTAPSRCDLLIYQGDDVVIPLFFNDPDIVGDDYSTGYEWIAQIRTRHMYTGDPVALLSVAATYHPSVTGVSVEYTEVEMLLPRTVNKQWGVYEWEIASYSTMDLSRFPAPPNWDLTLNPWPPAKSLKTWLYGRCIILPRTTTTDILSDVDPDVTTLGMNGIVLGPNGALSTGGNPSVGFDAFGERSVVPVVAS